MGPIKGAREDAFAGIVAEERKKEEQKEEHGGL